MPVNIHGKQYATVAERMQKIKELNYSLKTEMIKFDDIECVFKATLIIHDDTVFREFIGHAWEVKKASRINNTSFVECCETSAIGRALAAAGFAGNEYASADEVANAIQNQNKKTNHIKSNLKMVPMTLTEEERNKDISHSICDNYIRLLGACTTLDELKKTWSQINQTVLEDQDLKVLIKTKDQFKENILAIQKETMPDELLSHAMNDV